MRSPIPKLTYIHEKCKRVINNLDNITYRKGYPVWKWAIYRIHDCYNPPSPRLYNICGINNAEDAEKAKMGIIIRGLPSWWRPIMVDILSIQKPHTARKFIDFLENVERDIDPLWIKLDTEPMS